MQNKTIIQHPWTLSYRTEGKGYPVLLLHGFAEDGTIWEPQITALKDNYHLLIALLDKEEIPQCILIGHSMGGYITLAVAEKYPHRLTAFGLFHSTAYADSDEKIAGRRKSIEFIRKNGAPAYIRQSMPNLFAESSQKEHPEWIDSLIDRYTAFNPDALAEYQEAMISRPDRTHVLQQFAGPVLFIIGGQDPLIPLQVSLQQTHMPRLSHIHILEDAGHMGMLENTPASNNILDDFLRPYRSSH